MKALLIYPEFPDTFWGYKHALKFIRKKAAYPPLGLLTLAALLPLGGLLALSTYLSDAHLGYVFGFVACITLLQPVVRQRWQERRWEKRGLDYSTEVQFDTWQVAVMVTITDSRICI